MSLWKAYSSNLQDRKPWEDDDSGAKISSGDDSLSCVPKAKKRKLKGAAAKSGKTLEIIDLDALDRPPEVIEEESPAGKRYAARSKALQKDAVFEVVPVPVIQHAPNAEFQRLKNQNSLLMQLLQKAAVDAPIELSDSEDEAAPEEEPLSQSQAEVEEVLPPTPKPDAAVIFKVQMQVPNQGVKFLKIRLLASQTFQVLFDRFRGTATQRGWLSEGQAIKFLFDDDRLSGDQTLADLDCEGEETIDVV